jgi:hypothetical protein
MENKEEKNAKEDDDEWVASVESKVLAALQVYFVRFLSVNNAT